MTAPAPIAAAIEEARKAQRLYDSCPAEAKGNCVTCTPRLYAALRSLLAAISADKRLAEAERQRVPVNVSRWDDDTETMSFDGTTFTTVRPCRDCGVLICGGPTRCLYCAAKEERP